MNKTFFLQQISKTGNLDSKFISRQYKLMSDFMRVNYENPKLKQLQKSKQLGYSTSTLQRHRNDINTLSPCRIQPNNTNKRTKKSLKTNFDENTSPYHDDKRPQMTSKEINRLQVKTKTKMF